MPAVTLLQRKLWLLPSGETKGVCSPCHSELPPEGAEDHGKHEQREQDHDQDNRVDAAKAQRRNHGVEDILWRESRTDVRCEIDLHGSLCSLTSSAPK